MSICELGSGQNPIFPLFHPRRTQPSPPIEKPIEMRVPAKLSLWFSILAVLRSAADTSQDSTIRDSAFAAMSRGRTGVLYDVPLPAGLSGVAASVIRLRARSLWVSGADYVGTRIPPGAMPEPFVMRMAIVYQNLGNRSSSLYKVPGHSMVSPVLGLLVYDATNSSTTSGIQEIDLNLAGESVHVTFPELDLDAGRNSTTVRCVAFRRGGRRRDFGGPPSTGNSCSMKSLGHFAIVVPSPPAAAGDGDVAVVVSGKERGRMLRWLWLLAFGCGGVLVGLAGIGVMTLKRRRMVRMERRAEEGESLGSVWVGGVKMPQAKLTRTKPVTETGSPPAS